MKMSRRKFLGGVVAGVLAAVASGLPKMAAPIVKVAKRQPCEWGSLCFPGTWPNDFALPLPMAFRSTASITLLGNHIDTARPGSTITYGNVGEVPDALIIRSVRFDGHYTTIEAF